MKFEGNPFGDQSDPRRGIDDIRSRFPIPVASLASQPAVEVAHAIINTASHGASLDEMYAVITYTLWRNPQDRRDPVNLAATDTAINPFGTEYPLLWEAVRTSWFSSEDDRPSLQLLLAHHAQHVLQNQFGISSVPGEIEQQNAPAREVAATYMTQPTSSIMIDGIKSTGIEIISVPQIYGVGALLPLGGVVTAVVPVQEIEYISVSFSTN